MDKLDELALLIAILEQGSMAGGARKTQRSPAAATRILAEMEARLGVHLIDRNTRRLAPTEAGRRMAEHGRRLLGDYEETLRDITGELKQASGLLRVSAPLLFGRRHIAPLVHAFLDAQPGVRLDLMLSNHWLDLAEHEIDIALRIGPLADARLVAKPVGQVGRLLVASPDYVARRGSPASPADLAQHALILHAARGAPAQWDFLHTSVRVQGRLMLNQAESAIDAALAGQGIARPLSYQVADELKDARLLRLMPEHEPAPLPVHLLFAPARFRPQRVSLFIEFALAELAQRGIGIWC